MLSAAAGLIHFSAAPAHFSESSLHGSFFVVAGLLQIVAAGLLLRGGGTPLLRATAAGNIAVAGIWVMSRTIGLPIGPERWTPEAIGFADTTCSLIELLIVAGCLLMLSGRGRSMLERSRPHRSRTALATAGTAVFALTVFSVVALGTQTHVHGGSLAAEALAHASHGAAAGQPVAEGHPATAHAGAGDNDTASQHVHGGTATSPAAEAPGHQHAGVASAAGDDHAQTSASHTSHEHTAASAASHAAGQPDGSHNHARASTAAGNQAPAAPTQAIGPSSGDRQATVRYGPLVLPPASLGGMLHLNLIQPTLAKPCSNCFITSLTPNLVYADGTTANLDTGPMLHHVVWARPLVPDATCSGNVVGLLGERFFAAGNERTAWTMPAGFGYFVGDDPWNVVTEIMNHSEELKIVFVQLDATWRPAPDPSVKPVKPVWMDVADCATSEYHIPAGPTEETWTWASSLTGRIVATAGHLHSGGKEISLVNESTGNPICTSAARYGTKPGSMGSLDSMSVCAWDALGTVRAGEVLGIHSHYESPEPADDVMGIMLVYVYPTDDLAGGMAAPDSARAPVAPQAPAPPPAHMH